MLIFNSVVSMWILIINIDVSFGQDYCKFSSQHMLCDKGFQKDCGNKSDYIFKDITEDEKAMVLDLHNHLRNDIAMGKVIGARGADLSRPRKYFPPAANMEELAWDDELGSIAAGMAKKCIFEHLCGDSSCRRTERHSKVGENLYTSRSNLNLQEHFLRSNYDNATIAWFEEKELYYPEDINNFSGDNSDIARSGLNDYGHFTLLIWWRVELLGCAKIGFPSRNDGREGWSQIIIVCHYAPSGNLINSPIYEEGKPCSNCQGRGRTCSRTYRGLCAAESRSNASNPPIFITKELSSTVLTTSTQLGSQEMTKAFTEAFVLSKAAKDSLVQVTIKAIKGKVNTGRPIYNKRFSELKVVTDATRRSFRLIDDLRDTPERLVVKDSSLTSRISPSKAVYIICLSSFFKSYF